MNLDDNLSTTSSIEMLIVVINNKPVILVKIDI